MTVVYTADGARFVREYVAHLEHDLILVRVSAGKEVDLDGLVYATNRFDRSSDKRAVAKAMAREVIASEEFLGNNPTTDVYVTRLYRAFLGRFPNDSEVAHWADQLESGGMSLDDVIDLFGDSQEFTGRLGRHFGP